MILKLKLKEESRRNIGLIKAAYFDECDRITAGYIIGLAVDRVNEISEVEWKNSVNIVLNEIDTLGKSTSISLRQDVFERINHIKYMLEKLCSKSLYMSQVVDIILYIVAKKISGNTQNLESVTLMEWNVNARSGFADYVIPVNLIVNEVLDKKPHIFVLTEFVRSAGFVDLLSILEEEYLIYDSPYLVRENGVCIGIKKNSGIEYIEKKTKESVYGELKNTPDYYEVRVRMNSKIVSIIGTRIRINLNKSCSKCREERIAEYKSRYEQYSQIVEHILKLDHVIVLGDFNNSRIISSENETNETVIDSLYLDKDSKEYNFQKALAFVVKRSGGKFSLYTPVGDISSVGGYWDEITDKAKAPVPNVNFKLKLDHLLTDFTPEKLEYNWNFLKYYKKSFFTDKCKIKAGYPDHAVFLSVIKL